MTQRQTFQRPTTIRRTARRGISLMEVLISAFIIAVGLLGVAALLPVGHHEANQGTMNDRAALIGRQAFRDFHIRGRMPGYLSEQQILTLDANDQRAYLENYGPDVMFFPSHPLGLTNSNRWPRYRCTDDPRYSWFVWAGREPYLDTLQTSGSGTPRSSLVSIEPTTVRSQFGGNVGEDIGQNMTLNFVRPANPGAGETGEIDPEDDVTRASLDTGARVKVIAFVFFQEDDTQDLFDPRYPDRCPPSNRPIAVFEKVMTIEGTSSWNN